MVIVMVIFELKKIFLKPINKIAFIILVATLCVVSYLAIDYVSYVDENGERITGFAAAQALREEKNKWAGYITEDVLIKVLDENSIIVNSEGYLSNDVEESNKAYSKMQGFSDIKKMKVEHMVSSKSIIIILQTALRKNKSVHFMTDELLV